MDYYDVLLAKKLNGGGGGPSVLVEPLSVTQNGTYQEEGKAYSPVTVNVSGGDSHEIEDALLSGTLSGSYTNDRITTLRNYGLYIFQDVTSISLPNLVSVNIGALGSLTNCVSIYVPKLKNIDTANSLFANDTSLKNITLPSAIGVLPTSLVSHCSALESADFGAGVTEIKSADFSNCSELKTIVLRRTSEVVTLANTNVFNNSRFASNGAGGTLYVPQALVSAYQSATNWSTILGYTNNQIKSIESTHTDLTAPIDLTLYYADGTLIGA